MRDAGSSHVLEIVVVLAVMVSAVASVITFETTGSSLDPIDRMLTSRANDLLRVWSDVGSASPDPCRPTTLLDGLVYDGIAGDHSDWDDVVDARIGPGYDVDLVLDNYHAIMPLHGTGKVRGSSAAIDWMPEQTYAKIVPSVSGVTGTEHMIVDVPAVHWSTLAKTRGEAVRIGVDYSDTLGDHSKHVWAATGLLGDSSAWNNASATLWVGGQNPRAELAREPESGNLLLGVRESFSIKMEAIPPTNGVSSIPTGTALDITIPAGWRNVGWDEPRLSSWRNESAPFIDGEDYHLRAVVRDQPAAPSTLGLLMAPPAEPVRPFDIITARLSSGTFAESSLIVTFPVDASDQNLPRVLAPTAPYPLRLDQDTTFGVAFGNGGEALTIDEVNIEIPGGYDLTRNNGDGSPLFASVDNAASYPDHGWSVVDARHVQWTPDPLYPEVTVAAGKATFFTARIHTTADPMAATSIEPRYSPGANVTIHMPNDYATSTRSWGRSPGIPSLRMPPASRSETLGNASDGYAWSADAAALGESRPYDVLTNSTLARVSKSAEYRLRPLASDAVSFENAMADASFEVADRKVPVGTMLRVDGDLSSMITQLDQAGLDSSLTLELYAPPSLGCKPTRSWTIDTTNLPDPKIVATLLWDGGLPAPSLFAAADDGSLYRIDATSNPVWSLRTSGTPRTLARMDLGPAGAFLLVGTSTGKVQRVDAVDGSVSWTSIVQADGSPGTSVGMQTVAARYDPVADRGVAASGTDVVAFTTAGAKTISHRFGDIVRDVQTSPDGTFVLLPDRVSRLQDGWGTSDDFAPPVADAADMRGFAIIGGRLFAAGGHKVYIIDPATMQLTASIPFDGAIRLSARGDATGDGVDDFVVANADSTVAAISGQTGTIAWYENLYGSLYASSHDPHSNRLVVEGIMSQEIEEPSTCQPTVHPASYATPVMCGGDVGSDVMALTAGGGTTTVALRSGGVTRVYRFDHGGEGDFVLDDLEESISAVDTTAWGVSSHALALGSTIGTVRVYSDDLLLLVEASPGATSGRFTFYTLVPEGGFFGTHLLVARLSWQTADDLAQEAQLVDWFVAVAQDGTPVLNPAYRIALTVLDRADGS